jgi:hypothetical protein
MWLTLPSSDVGGLLCEDINKGLVASFLRKLSIFLTRSFVDHKSTFTGPNSIQPLKDTFLGEC